MPLSNIVPRGFEFIYHSIAILYHEVPNLSITIRTKLITARGALSQATEAEVAITFAMRPKRALLVGDPQQLQATLLSEDAQRAGLGRSLMQRLMHDCAYPFTLLDTQVGGLLWLLPTHPSAGLRAGLRFGLVMASIRPMM